MTELLRWNGDFGSTPPEIVVGAGRVVNSDYYEIVPEPGNGSAYARWAAIAQPGEPGLTVRFYVKYAAQAYATTSMLLFGVYRGSAVLQVKVAGASGTGGQLRLYNGAGTQVASSGSGVLVADAWQRVEIKWLGDTGTITVYHPNESVNFTFSGAVPQADYNAIIIGHWGTSPTSPTINIDDLVWDNDGTASPVGVKGSEGPAPTTNYEIAQWNGGIGTPFSSVVGAVNTTGGSINLSPVGASTQATVDWNAGKSISTGAAVRFYARVTGEWGAQSVGLCRIQGAGGTQPIRVECAGPGQGLPGQIRLVNEAGDTLASSEHRYMPLGVWRRVEIKWSGNAVTVTVYNRLDEVAFSISAEVPAATYTTVQLGNYKTSVSAPLMSFNGFRWSASPALSPLGVVGGVIPQPVTDDSSVGVWDGSTIKTGMTQVWDGSTLRAASLTTT